jgi:outer membrane protein assembly factor BamB
MTAIQTNAATPRRPLRLWPGVVAVASQWLIRFVIPVVVPLVGLEADLIGVIGGVAGGLAVLVWWLFFSRAPWSERLGAIAVMIVVMAATPRILHVSIQDGMMGFMFFIYGIPTLSLAFVGWAVLSRRLADGPRRATMVASILLGCAVWALVRTNGIVGGANSDLAWRWTPTAEERLLASAPAALNTDPAGTARGATVALPPAPAAEAPVEKPLVAPATDKPLSPPVKTITERVADWPGFRGRDRNNIIRGVRIETDWSKSPPVALWHRPIGPGWSSFAVDGNFFYTQEQRGDDEIVACYDMATGMPVWMHRDPTRFWESNGGAGPRATPTLSNGRVYTFGATGILNALDARDGSVLWSHNATADTGKTVPGWGFSSSPLVVGDLVVVHAGLLVAYDRVTGVRRWIGPDRGGGYSSPQLFTIDGVAQIVLMSGAGATAVSPADGTPLWEHAFAGAPIVQPASIGGGDLLISTTGAAGGEGARRIAVARGPRGWTVEERWASNGLKPYFNDFVVHKGHAFGFDGSILACIDLEDGKRKWKGGRYGNGQLVLLTDQDLLLVLSEEGELALVSATTDKFTEIARFPALEGKTWNHPVLVGDVLLVRNGEEMAAFRLSLAAR